MSKLLLADETYEIRGAIYEVYREMGCGFLEAVYQECLEKEFAHREIPFESQPELKLQYKGQALDARYRPDFVCYDSIVVELKALRETGKEQEAQVHNYLRATGLRVRLLVNFGHHPKATVDRIVV